MAEIRIVPIVEGVFGVETDCGDGVDVRALLVRGTRHSLLVDTLLRPSDLERVQELVDEWGTAILVVNSHADWDHWWGNAAFPKAPVIAHRLTQARQNEEGERSLAQMREQRDDFEGVVLQPATVGFEGTLHLDLGGCHAELSLLPGHTHDCIVVWLPEHRLLFAGDVAEDPIPLVTEGPIAGWPEALHMWADTAHVVVPAHGAVTGPDLLRRNAQYLEGLLSSPERHVPELENADPFYQGAHVRNLTRAEEERGKA